MPEPTSYVTVVGEGPTDEAILRRVVTHCGLSVARAMSTRGKGRLDPKLAAYAKAAALPGQLWLVLRDLDRDAPCAPELRRRLLPTAPPNLVFRIAVRQAEAWLLADREGLGEFLSVPLSKLPEEPDLEVDAKGTLVNLARLSRQRQIRLDVVPDPETRASVGPGYTARILEFVQGAWQPARGAARSPSLASCLAALARRSGS